MPEPRLIRLQLGEAMPADLHGAIVVWRSGDPASADGLLGPVIVLGEWLVTWDSALEREFPVLRDAPIAVAERLAYPAAAS